MPRQRTCSRPTGAQRIESSGHCAEHGIAHFSEVLVVGEVSGPDQFDTGLVETALDELPCKNSCLSVCRDEYEQRIGTKIPRALEERGEVRIHHRHLMISRICPPPFVKRSTNTRPASVPGAKSECTTTARLLPFLTAHSAMIPDCCPNVKLVRTM